MTVLGPLFSHQRVEHRDINILPVAGVNTVGNSLNQEVLLQQSRPSSGVQM